MMYELNPVNYLFNPKHKVKLHPKVIEILFENRRYIKKIFSNLRGLYGITHMGMSCIDPSLELITFSTTPNIECNLIHQNLWSEDSCFTPDVTHKNSLLWWECQSATIETIKLKDNHFTLGMTICRPISNFIFLYSFATEERCEGLRTYYNENLHNLIDMGDYFYKSLRAVYNSYDPSDTPPMLSEFTSKAIGHKIKPFLRIVPNMRK